MDRDGGYQKKHRSPINLVRDYSYGGNQELLQLDNDYIKSNFNFTLLEWYALGTDIDKAKQSLNTILSFMKDSDTKEIICDKVVLSKNNFEKALSMLDNKAEAKVAKAIAKNKEKAK